VAAQKRSSSSSGAAKKRTVVRGNGSTKKTNLSSSSNASVESLASSAAKENLDELSIAPASKRSSRFDSEFFRKATIALVTMGLVLVSEFKLEARLEPLKLMKQSPQY
jgi:hypothetical protein